jgi:hypothetical protein
MDFEAIRHAKWQRKDLENMCIPSEYTFFSFFIHQFVRFMDLLARDAYVSWPLLFGQNETCQLTIISRGYTRTLLPAGRYTHILSLLLPLSIGVYSYFIRSNFRRGIPSHMIKGSEDAFRCINTKKNCILWRNNYIFK